MLVFDLYHLISMLNEHEFVHA